MEARQPFDATGEPRHETRGDQRGLSGPRRSDDVDLALAAAQAADDAIELDVATEEPARVALGERPHAGVRTRKVRFSYRGPIKVRAQPIDLRFPCLTRRIPEI